MLPSFLTPRQRVGAGLEFGVNHINNIENVYDTIGVDIAGVNRIRGRAVFKFVVNREYDIQNIKPPVVVDIAQPPGFESPDIIAESGQAVGILGTDFPPILGGKRKGISQGIGFVPYAVDGQGKVEIFVGGQDRGVMDRIRWVRFD